MFVCCECCVLSVRGLCDELITRAEESYLLWCVMCNRIPKNKEVMAGAGSSVTRNKRELQSVKVGCLHKCHGHAMCNLNA
jgi:hypothetical protein